MIKSLNVDQIEYISSAIVVEGPHNVLC